MKKVIIMLLIVFKHLFYDIIPEFYNIKWNKKDFDTNLEYYFIKPVVYLFGLIVSLLDVEVAIHRIIYIFGFVKGVLWNEKEVFRNI